MGEVGRPDPLRPAFPEHTGRFRAAVITAQAGWILALLSLPTALFAPVGVPVGTLLLLVAAPLAAQLLQLAILRSR